MARLSADGDQRATAAVDLCVDLLLTGVADVTCPPNWISGRREEARCYAMFDTRRNHAAADRHCRTLDATLVDIRATSAAELLHLLNAIRSGLSTSLPCPAFFSYLFSALTLLVTGGASRLRESCFSNPVGYPLGDLQVRSGLLKSSKGYPTGLLTQDSCSGLHVTNSVKARRKKL